MFLESKMVVRSAKPQHKGLYQCFAENIAGIQYATMEVDVNTNKVHSGEIRSLVGWVLYNTVGLCSLEDSCFY